MVHKVKENIVFSPSILLAIMSPSVIITMKSLSLSSSLSISLPYSNTSTISPLYKSSALLISLLQKSLISLFSSDQQPLDITQKPFLQNQNVHKLCRYYHSNYYFHLCFSPYQAFKASQPPCSPLKQEEIKGCEKESYKSYKFENKVGSEESEAVQEESKHYTGE